MDLFGNEGTKVVKFTNFGNLRPDAIVHIPGLSLQSNLYVLDFGESVSERIAVLPCFGKKNYIFAYGHDLGRSTSTVTLLVMFATKSNCYPADTPQGWEELLHFYDKNRVSKSGARILVQILTKGKFASGYLVSMQLSGYAPQLNAAVVQFTFLSTEDD